MLDLRNGDCLKILKDIPNKTIDLVFADLPYGQINCKWDCKIDLELLWKELLRVAKSDHTPFFFTATTKFGYELIKSNEKMFRYDLVWAKSNPCGFLQAKKQPMRKHEMLYVFYKKQPAYDISSHRHKFKKEESIYDVVYEKDLYGVKRDDRTNKIVYDPPLPTSVIKEDTKLKEDGKKGIYPHDTKYRYDHLKKNGVPKPQVLYDPPLPTSIIKEEEDKVKYSLTPSEGTYREINRPYYKCKNGENNTYDPPLPTSVIKEEIVVNERGDTQIIENAVYGNDNFKILNYHHPNGKLVREPRYDPPLPTSIIKEDEKIKSKETSTYGKTVELGIPHTTTYDPPLPTSVIKEEVVYDVVYEKDLYGVKRDDRSNKIEYDPPLPTSLLEIKSIRLKQHSTAKPPDLMKWILKYYSKEGDTILDPTMGSNPMGLACKEMNRKFIGIEMDSTIYNFACDRVK